MSMPADPPTGDAPLQRLAAHLGVMPRYQALDDRWHDTSDDTLRAIVSAMGFDATGTDGDLAVRADELAARDAMRALPDWIVVQAGQPGPDISADWRLCQEDGTETEGRGTLPALPLGRHALMLGDACTWLLAAPARLPHPPRSWGITLPLYGLRSAATGGIGSYGDLCDVVAGLSEQRVGFVGLNPIHAGFPGDDAAFSPYSPSSRRRFSTLHIEAGAMPDDHGDLIDYDVVLAAQQDALKAGYEAFIGDPAFDAFLADQGEPLRLFALHQALSARHGPYWPHWPAALRDPDTPEVRAFAAHNPDALRYHGWLQWRAEEQLAQVRRAAGPMALGLYLDLAVGTHPDGAETWADPALFARGCSLGAPPDGFSPDGQRWNLAPMRPDTLAATGFAALADILRAQLRHAGVLRIDHILGFERAFWVPENAPGAYVTMPKEALLAVARIEAARAGAVIVGEDLGNIPKGLHDDLDASGILGCRVAMFEQDWDAASPRFKPAETYDVGVLTSFASHDLPTYRGWRRGRDIDWRSELGSIDPDDRQAAMAQRAAEAAALAEAVGGASIGNLNAFLARTPSHLVAVQAEDLLGRIEQPNLPGTVYDHPNWRRRLGPDPDELVAHPAIAQTAEIMKSSGR